MQRIVAIAFILMCSLACRPASAEQPVQWETLTKQPTWVFLGDSNTYAGRYVAFVDAAVRKQLGAAAPTILNLGVSSETASGLSEPDHPFPRPCVHSRLEKTLAMVQPDVVFACYGMNDGIYHPLDPKILQAYREGMLRLATEVRKSGATLIILTPPVFEGEVSKKNGKLGPTEEGHYAWFAPAEEYDEVIEQMSQWCQENSAGADLVIDLRTSLRDFKKQMRQTDPDYFLTGDSVHFHAPAHDVVAHTVLEAIGMPAELAYEEITAEEIAASATRIGLLRDAYLSAAGKNRPGLAAGLPPVVARQKVAALLEAEKRRLADAPAEEAGR